MSKRLQGGILLEPDEPYALAPKAAAKRLDIDVSTLYRNYGNALRSGRIENYKIGTARRIVWQSLLRYIREAGRNGSA